MHRGLHEQDFSLGWNGDGERGASQPGHNRVALAAQWQTPHRPDCAAPEPTLAREPDLDLVEASFVEGFSACSDPTSFLRLAGVPFVARDAAGRRLTLLRVEITDLTDVGALTPLLGGAGTRYAPLPGRLASRRRRLSLAYHDDAEVVRLAFAEARALAPITEPE